MKTKTYTILKGIALKNDVPLNLLVGIYTLETTYRKWYHRIIEYTFTIFFILMNIFFNVKVKNYTIGHCQVGIANILTFYGKSTYEHSRYLYDFTFTDLKNVIKAMKKRNNIEICSLLVKRMFLYHVMLQNKMNLVYRMVGQEYNGSYTYGLLLERICMTNKMS